MKKLIKLLVFPLSLIVFISGAQADTLGDVRDRGALNCIINTGLTGFAFTNDAGKWEGFDVDLCRAVAAATLGDADKVRYVNATGKTRFTLLNSGEGDMLSRNTTWTYSRDADVGLTFVGVNYYDGQGFIAHKKLGVSSAKELDGASICIQTGTTTELNLADFFRSNNISYEPVPIETNEEARVFYEKGRCDAYTTDASGLAATRAVLNDPSAHVILSDIISKEPLGPAVREGDDRWADVVRWVLNVMINAEEYGVTSSNVDSLARGTDNPEINRMLGSEGDLGAMLGLSKDFGYQIIKQVGNYGEVYSEYLTPLGLARGLNNLYDEGGILYAPPMR